MSDKSKIEWTDATWNPVTGCTKVSAGCKNCYAERLIDKRGRMGKVIHGVDEPFSRVTTHPDRLDQPLRWRKPRRVFACSTGDLFHEDVPWDFIVKAWLTMARAPQHTYQILTKRPKRMLEFCSSEQFSAGPFDHVWIGVSAENQAAADERIPLLLQTPAAVRFVSVEPMLGPVSLRWMNAFPENAPYTAMNPSGVTDEYDGLRRLDWIICGGESGPNARPMHPDWVRSLRDQCVAAGVPFYFKSWGEWGPWERAGNYWYGIASRSCCKGGPPAWKGKWMMADENLRFERVGTTSAGRSLDGETWEQEPEAK